MTYQPLFHVVLYEPEIPQNTGNIGRLCVATHSHLHLVGPLGFELNVKARRRAGLDYWDKLVWDSHDAFSEIESDVPRDRLWFFSKKGSVSLYDVSLREGDYLVFGCETAGLPEYIHAQYADRMVRIPMVGEVRSLNLANAAAVALFEALRQTQNGESAQ